MMMMLGGGKTGRQTAKGFPRFRSFEAQRKWRGETNTDDGMNMFPGHTSIVDGL